jgi:glycosyltransferase involved in cell wall biosynthesis
VKIMLYSDIPPCQNYTAGIVLDKLCDFLLEARHEVCCFYVEAKGVNAVVPEDKKERMAFCRVQKPPESYGRKLKGIAGKLLSLLGNNYEALFHLPKIVKRAAAFAEENGAELIWSVVQGQTMIKTTRPLAKRVDLPYVFQIWDPPTWWLRDNGFDRFTAESVLKEYSAAIRESICCITASEAMNAEYLKRYAPKRAVPVILGFDTASVQPAAKSPNSFVITMSGQTYASQELLTLIDALKRLGWSHNGKRIVLQLCGQYFGVLQNISFAAHANIEIRGWLSLDELLPELAAADMCYCPYWFDPMFREEASLSFPSKLSTYLKAAAPVLIHAPEYASPRKFIEEHDAGYVCGSLDGDVLAEMLRKIMDDPERAAVGKRGYQAFCAHLSLEVMRNSFFDALGLR